MLVRAARPEDWQEILELAHALGLGYSGMDLSCFLVAERNGRIVSIAELKDFHTFYLLSCVGVREELQRTGIGQAFIEEVLNRAPGEVYLYTMVPDFFRKLGFVEAKAVPNNLPTRAMYGCADCQPSHCLCLVRPFDAPGLSDLQTDRP